MKRRTFLKSLCAALVATRVALELGAQRIDVVDFAFHGEEKLLVTSVWYDEQLKVTRQETHDLLDLYVSQLGWLI